MLRSYEQLHRRECMIDPKANDILYDGNKTLADALSNALKQKNSV